MLDVTAWEENRNNGLLTGVLAVLAKWGKRAVSCEAELEADTGANRTSIFHMDMRGAGHDGSWTALESAKRNGALISYSLNEDTPLILNNMDENRRKVIEGLHYADLVSLSEEALSYITGTKDLEKGTLLIAELYDVKLVLMNLEAKDCYYRLGTQTGCIPYVGDKHAAGSGEGDAVFEAGILYSLLEREGLLEALTVMELQQMIAFALTARALAGTKEDGVIAIPSLEDIQELLNQADAAEGLTDTYRPQYHFTPADGWMNDPNGMVYYEGEYHLCYQYHPWSSKWGPMHWGHAVSRDLVHWEFRPAALKPDRHGFIFSGSTVVDWKDTSGFFDGGSGLVAIFTHADEYPETGRPRQRQSLAYSKDKGRTWVKYACNPVLQDEDITDFRDPKVFWHEQSGRWVMVLAAGDHARFYISPNLIDWTLSGTFGEAEGSHDGVWECPDLFELPVDGDTGHSRWVLLISIGDQGGLPEGSRTQYFIGHFDGERFVNDLPAETILWMDHGRDNYAGVTWSDVPDTDGRRILIGWMSNWKYANLTPTERWRSAMTIPRVMGLTSTKDGIRLIQTPVEELHGLRREAVKLADVTVQPGHNPLADFKGSQYELEAVFELGTAAEFGFKVRCGEQEETVVGYDAVTNELFIDRTQSGVSDFHPQFACKHGAVLEPEGPKLHMRIYVDWSSVEVFAGGGRAVLTDQIFPSPESGGLELYVKDGSLKLVSLSIYSLDSIHGNHTLRTEEAAKL